MYDSGAWKPLLLLPIILVGIVAERGLTTLFEGIIGVPLILFAILGLLLIFRFAFYEEPQRPHQKPTAEYIDEGIIEVFGDAENLLSKFNNVSSASTWTKSGDRRWIVEIPAVNKEHTRYIVEAINIGRNL